jgi:alanine racemase
MLIRPTYAIVDLEAIRSNVRNIKSALPARTMFCAVDKADGYGHGSVMVASAAIEAGADWIAVAIPEEAAPLREEGIKAPILVLGPSNLSQWRLAAELDLSMVVASEDCVQCARCVSRETGKPMRLHLKADTGMNRIGVRSERELDRILDMIESEPGLLLEGLMTHFATADEADKAYTTLQNERFKSFARQVNRRGLSPVLHAANSGGAIDCPDTAYDMVRVGIALYGCYPSDEVCKNIRLKPAMSVHTQISFIKAVEAGAKLSYGCTFTAQKEMRVATLPIGYADGYNRLLSNRGEVLIRGRRARVVGRVCMDQILVDVTDIEDVKLHDEAVCIGKQGKDEITAEEIANLCGTVNYEILCAISPRVPRLYAEG